MTIKKLQYFSDAHCSASMDDTITTTKIAIQNGIKQSCRVNTFWSMDDYVAKLEKCSWMFLASSDFLSKDSYAPKIAAYGLISCFFFIITYSNDCLAFNLSLKLLLWKRPTQTRFMKGKENDQWSLADQCFRP